MRDLPMPLLPLLDVLAAPAHRSDEARPKIGPVKGCLRLVGLLLRRRPS